MLAQIITENGTKKLKRLTADAGAGNPVGTIIPMYKKSNPSGYLYCDGSTFDETAYPLLYAYLGSNVLPDYDTSRQSGEPYSYIKATSGLSENAQDNVVAQLNEERSYSTDEVNTGKKWIDGKPIYRKVVVDDTPTNNEVLATNVDNLISQGGYLLWENTTKYNIPWVTSSGYNVNCKLESNTVYLNIANTGSYLNKVWVTLEYTKTT